MAFCLEVFRGLQNLCSTSCASPGGEQLHQETRWSGHCISQNSTGSFWNLQKSKESMVMFSFQRRNLRSSCVIEGGVSGLQSAGECETELSLNDSFWHFFSLNLEIKTNFKKIIWFRNQLLLRIAQSHMNWNGNWEAVLPGVMSFESREEVHMMG